MIKYALKCGEGHRFEGWFSSMADYDRQEADDLLECPSCGSAKVEKDIMAPAIASAPRERTADVEKREAVKEAVTEAMRRARRYVETNFDNVGKNFAEEARKIHYGETEERGIYGEATKEEVKELTDEGVEIAPLPSPPETPEERKQKLN